MKKVYVACVLAATMLFATAAPALAGSYNYNGTFYHILYAAPTFKITGSTKMVGSQSKLSGTGCWVRYALVSKPNSDPMNDTIYTYKNINGAVGYNFYFASMSRSNIRLRLQNLNWKSSSPYANQLKSSGTFSGSLSY